MREVEKLNLAKNFLPDYKVAEITCPTRYFAEASSIPLARATKYGLGVLQVSLEFRLAKLGVLSPRIFSADGKRLEIGSLGHQHALARAGESHGVLDGFTGGSRIQADITAVRAGRCYVAGTLLWR